MVDVADVESGGGIGTDLVLLDDEGVGTVRVVELGVVGGPAVARRVGEGGGREEEALCGPLDVVGDLAGEGRLRAGLFPVETMFPTLSALPTLLVSLCALDSGISRTIPFMNVFQPHSSEPSALCIDLALHPAPTPSMAAFGLSCSLKSSQFA